MRKKHERRSLRGSNLQGSRLLQEDGMEPMASMGNLMDVMLVFACCLMLALVANWNVNLGDVRANGGISGIKEVEGDLNIVEEGISDGSSYRELGVAYIDEETGQKYIIAPDAQE